MKHTKGVKLGALCCIFELEKQDVSKQIEFLERCKAVGLHSGSLFDWLDRVEQLQAENANLLAANRDCLDHFNALLADYDALKPGLAKQIENALRVAKKAIEGPRCECFAGCDICAGWPENDEAIAAIDEVLKP